MLVGVFYGKHIKLTLIQIFFANRYPNGLCSMLYKIKYRRLRVKYASEIFSRTASAYIEILSNVQGITLLIYYSYYYEYLH